MAGTGPKNLPRTRGAAFGRTRGTMPGRRRPRNPRASARLASAGYGNPPGGAASGIPKATSPFSSPGRAVNKPKSQMVSKGSRGARPRADFPSRI